MSHNPFFYPPPTNPFIQPQLLPPQQQQQLQMQAAILQHQKGFPSLIPQQQSILGTPPGGPHRGIPINPFQLNAGVFNRGVGIRGGGGGGKPHLTTTYKKPIPSPLPVDNSEVLVKLAKLVPELNNTDKFIANAKTFNELLNRGLNKQTASLFYSALETLSANIGKEEFNKVAVWRVFEYAFLKKYLFSGNPAHLDNITKWKTEADTLIKPAGVSAKSDRKHPLLEVPNPGAKRPRIIPFSQKTYNLVDVGQQVEVLQEELVSVKEELKAFRDDFKREVDFLYQHLNITPPAPPTPEPEDVEPEAEAPAEPEAATEVAEGAAETTEPAAEEAKEEEEEAKTSEVEMAEPSANGDEK